MNPDLVLAVARADNGVIGCDGNLPWRLSRDLKHYRAMTMGKPIIMGRKTHEAIGRPLPGRDNIIITRNRKFTAPGCHVVDDFESAIAAAKRLAEQSGAKEICVIGGAAIYRLALTYAKRIYLTEVHFQAEGDVVLGAFEPDQWREISRERYAAEGDDSADFSFVVLERQTPRHS